MSDTGLSPSGRKRREQILNMAIQRGRQRRRRRLVVRGGAVTIMFLSIGFSVQRLSRSIPRPNDLPITDSVPLAISAPNRGAVGKVFIERIQTDPTIARRLAVPQSPPCWQRLDDDHLLKELAQAGKPAGLVKINGQVTLIYHHTSR